MAPESVNQTTKQPHMDRERVLLGISALDNLLDRSKGGLSLPKEGDKGGCNIVIRGRPGTGKSTLALQIARAIPICKKGIEEKAGSDERLAEEESKTNYFLVYASLENAPEAIIDHASDFGWNDRDGSPKNALLKPIECLQDLDERPSQPRLADALDFILRGCQGAPKENGKCTARLKGLCKSHGPVPPQVLFPKLSPRSLRPDPAAIDELFWRRYYELENLLNAAASLHEKYKNEPVNMQPPQLKLVVVDSLNVFGDRPLGRDELFRLFDLFTRHGVAGVFVAEERESSEDALSPQMHYTTVDYLADTVIAMQSREITGYQLQSIAVVKSRYQCHSFEEHPFKIFTKKRPDDEKAETGTDESGKQPIEDKADEEAPSGIVIYPSIHAVLRRTRAQMPTTDPGAEGGSEKVKIREGDVEQWKAGYEAAEKLRKITDDTPEEDKPRMREEARPGQDQANALRFSECTDKLAADHKTMIRLPAIIDRIAAAEKLDYYLGQEGNATGYSGFGELDRMGDFKPGRAACIAVVGESATFKSSIGRNFALRATVCGYESIIITFNDRPETEQFSNIMDGPGSTKVKCSKFEFSRDIFQDSKQPLRDWRWDREDPPYFELCTNPPRGTRLPFHKAQKHYYHITRHEDESVFGSLALMNFAPGVLLPEEFIAELLYEIGDDRKDMLRRCVKRVVIDDATRIGLSYPLLVESPTAGDLFLTCVVDLLKSRGIDVMLVSSLSDEPRCKLVNEQVTALADAVVQCRFYDVFGQRYVGITGESSGRSSGLARTVTPGVIVRTGVNQNVLRIDKDILSGLVGFESGQIQRPGVSLYLFEEDSQQHKDYNRSLDVLVHRAFCQQSMRLDVTPRNERPALLPVGQTNVSVEVFASKDSGPVHESLDMLQDKPIDRTLIMTVDEFWTEQTGSSKTLEDLSELADKLNLLPTKNNDDTYEAEKVKSLVSLPGSPIEGIPYYGNVLLLAYRNDVFDNAPDLSTWEKISSIDMSKEWPEDLTDVTHPLEFDLTAPETLSCLFIDLLLNWKGPLTSLPDSLKAKSVENVIGKAKQTSVLTADTILSGDMDDIVKNIDAGYLAYAQKMQLIDRARGQAVISLLTGDAPEMTNSRRGTVEFLARAAARPDCKCKEHKDRGRRLTPHAAVYCCWYSQLRELVHAEPELADKLNVIKMPAGGFRGDWYLGVVKGSVSIELGKRLVETLCLEAEEYERFAQGVGLPTRAAFSDKEEGLRPGFMAWPGSPCKLDEVLDIHRNALSRSSIQDYRDFRNVLVILFKQLIGFELPKRDAAGILNVLGPQIRMFQRKPD